MDSIVAASPKTHSTEISSKHIEIKIDIGIWISTPDTDISRITKASLAHPAAMSCVEERRVCRNLRPLTSEYRIGEKLGHGGYAHVYAATRACDAREVAVKILDPAKIKAWEEVSLVFIFGLYQRLKKGTFCIFYWLTYFLVLRRF